MNRYSQLFDTINNATGFAQGEKWDNEKEIRDYFTVETLAQCFSGSIVKITGTDDRAAVSSTSYPDGTEMTEDFLVKENLTYVLQSDLDLWADTVISEKMWLENNIFAMTDDARSEYVSGKSLSSLEWINWGQGYPIVESEDDDTVVGFTDDEGSGTIFGYKSLVPSDEIEVSGDYSRAWLLK